MLPYIALLFVLPTESSFFSSARADSPPAPSMTIHLDPKAGGVKYRFVIDAKTL